MNSDDDDRLFDTGFDRVVAGVLGLDHAPGGDTPLTQVGLDSLGFLGLLMALEDEFDNLWPIEYLTGFPNTVSVESLRKAAREVLWQGGR